MPVRADDDGVRGGELAGRAFVRVQPPHALRSQRLHPVSGRQRPLRHRHVHARQRGDGLFASLGAGRVLLQARALHDQPDGGVQLADAVLHRHRPLHRHRAPALAQTHQDSRWRRRLPGHGMAAGGGVERSLRLPLRTAAVVRGRPDVPRRDAHMRRRRRRARRVAEDVDDVRRSADCSFCSRRRDVRHHRPQTVGEDHGGGGASPVRTRPADAVPPEGHRDVGHRRAPVRPLLVAASRV